MSIAEKLKKLSFTNINGSQYLGEKEKKEGIFTIKNAVPLEDSFEETVREWIKKDNLDQLETIEEEGMHSVTSKKLTEEHKMQIDILAAKAEYAIKYAVKNLENNSF